MSYEDVVVQSVRQKIKYGRSYVFDYIPHTEIIDPTNKFRHSGAGGSTGTGKTTNRIATIECRLKQGFKVICFDQQDELDFIGLPCPSNHPIYPKLVAHGRKAYSLKTRVLLPLAYEGGNRVVQYDEIPVNWEFFLLDLYDIEVTNQDWNVLLGGLSGVREQILKTALLKKEPEWGILDVYTNAQMRFLQGDFGYPDVNVDAQDAKPIPIVKGIFPKQSITTLNRALMNLNSARFLAPHIWRGHRTPYLLDLEKEILDRRTVTIIKTSLLPAKLRHALCTYLLRKTFLLAEKRYLTDGTRIPPISFMVPEATDFFPKNIPEEYRETLPPLRETFYTIFRRGRRHQVVIDWDSAYLTSIDDEIINQTHYLFLYNNDKAILNDYLNRFNPLNKESLQGTFDLLKDKGCCLYLCRHNPRGMFLRDIVPSCRTAMEGESFIDLWQSLDGKFKPVEPYYRTVNRIYADIKERVRKVFRNLEERMKMADKMPFSGSAEKFARYIYERSQKDQKTSYQQSEIINDYYGKEPDSPSKVSLYQFCEKLHKLGFIQLNKEKRPYTIAVNLKKLGMVFEKKKEETEVSP